MKQHFCTIKLISVSSEYEYRLSHNSPKRKACLWVKINILCHFTGNGGKLTQSVIFSPQTSFPFRNAVRWPVVISYWHRYQFNCTKMLLLSHFAEWDYRGYFMISDSLNLVLNSGNSGRDLMIWNFEHTVSLNVST